MPKLHYRPGERVMSHWPIHRRCANTLCAYGILPIFVGNVHYDQANPMIFSSRKHSSPKTSYSPENELQVPFTRVEKAWREVPRTSLPARDATTFRFALPIK